MNHLPKILGYHLAGERLVLSGKVLDGLYEPVEDVVLDFWQEHSSRDYINLGHILRERLRVIRKAIISLIKFP